MQLYIVRRILLLLPTLIGVTFVVFIAIRFLPGDIVDTVISDQSEPTPEYRAYVEKFFGLDEPVPQAYVGWLGDIIRGDFGDSFLSRRPVWTELQDRIPVSFELGILAMIYSILIAIPIGVVSAVRQDSWVDYLARSFAILMLAVPSFWAAQLVLIYGFDWFGWTPPLQYRTPWDEPLTNIRNMWIPAVILGSFLSGSVMRLTRSTMLEVMRQDFVRTARAKGLAERTVITRHALRNAVLPVVTVIGLQVGVLIGGTVILERLFSLPGMGRYLLSSLEARDYPVVQAIVLLSATLVLFVNLVVDLSYALIDPRIRYS